MKFTVAIDGPAAAGKGMISKAVAQHFGFAHLDTGLLYRAVGAKVLAGQDAIKAAETLQPDEIIPDQLRTNEIAEAASIVAPNPQVRAILAQFQRGFARRDNGAVLDGRDIGTVICPDADVKLYVTASAETRAQRRYKELSAKGADITPEGVLADVIARDQRDQTRATAPMIAADDALTLDTTDMTIDAAVAAAIAAIDAAMG